MRHCQENWQINRSENLNLSGCHSNSLRCVFISAPQITEDCLEVFHMQAGHCFKYSNKVIYLSISLLPNCSIPRLFLIEYDRTGCSKVPWGFLPHSGWLHGGSQGHCGVVLGWFGVCVHMLAAFPKEIRRIHVLYVCKSEDVIRKAWLPTGQSGKWAQRP